MLFSTDPGGGSASPRRGYLAPDGEDFPVQPGPGTRKPLVRNSCPLTALSKVASAGANGLSARTRRTRTPAGLAAGAVSALGGGIGTSFVSPSPATAQLFAGAVLGRHKGSASWRRGVVSWTAAKASR